MKRIIKILFNLEIANRVLLSLIHFAILFIMYKTSSFEITILMGLGMILASIDIGKIMKDKNN